MKAFTVGIAALAIGLAGCSRTEPPEQVVEGLIKAVENRDCDDIAGRLSESSRQMVGNKLVEACRQEAKTAKGDATPKKNQRELEKLHVLERTENGDRVTVRLQPEFENGTREAPQNFILVKEDGAWKIDLLATGMASGGPSAPAQ